MIIRRTVLQFFKVQPEFGRVPPVVSRPGRKQVVASRPPLAQEGNELFLLALPSKRQLRVQILSKLIHFELNKEEISIISSIAPMLALDPDQDTIMENILLRDFSSEFIPEKERELFSKELKENGYLSFVPTKALAQLRSELLVVRRWKARTKIVRPQRKRGYDDKGTLAPPDSINWREIAQLNSTGPLNFETDADSIHLPERSDLRVQSHLTRATSDFIREAETFVYEFLRERRER